MSTICEKDRKKGARERDGRMIAKRERLRGGNETEGDAGRDSLPGPVLIVPGNEGVIK